MVPRIKTAVGRYKHIGVYSVVNEDIQRRRYGNQKKGRTMFLYKGKGGGKRRSRCGDQNGLISGFNRTRTAQIGAEFDAVFKPSVRKKTVRCQYIPAFLQQKFYRFPCKAASVFKNLLGGLPCDKKGTENLPVAQGGKKRFGQNAAFVSAKKNAVPRGFSTRSLHCVCEIGGKIGQKTFVVLNRVEGNRRKALAQKRKTV